MGYATSFFGIVDLLAVIPTYISLLIPGSQSLLNIRVLRLLRIFRVFKLTAYLSEAKVITNALRASRRKISVFLLSVVTIVVIIGSLMYIIEGEKKWVHRYPYRNLLGHRDLNNSGLWRLIATDSFGQGTRISGHDHGLWNSCGPDRNCDRGDFPGFQGIGIDPDLSSMQYQRT